MIAAADSGTMHWPRLWAETLARRNQTEIRRGDYRNSAAAAGAADDDDGGDGNAGTDCGCCCCCGIHTADCCYRLAIASCKWRSANLPLCNCCAPDQETWAQKRL